MKTTNKICQNCKNDFTIERDDFSFYEKIKVPPPTFCPECRMVRRILWRNERSLKKRECGLCKKSLISMYPEDGAPIYCKECWNGDQWDQFINAREYSFKKPFFEQLKDLFAINPRFYAYKFGNFVNSEFVNYAKDNKNVYLSYSVISCEDILYSNLIDKSKNTLDSLNVVSLDGCSYNISCEGNYNTHYALQSQTCVDSYFIYDCINCSNCFLSCNLRNQQYVFKNQKFSREEYFKQLEDYKLNTYEGIKKAQNEFDLMFTNNAIHKFAFIYASKNVSGDYIHNAQNIKHSFDTYESENVAYSNRVLYAKDCFDMSGVGYGEVVYESVAATQNTFMDFFCYLTIEGCRGCEYSLILKNCSNCFGCVGLTNAQYCILNKQYSKEEYFKMVEKIKKHMMEMPYVDSKGRVFRYGEFFPYDMCPFGYNETNAHDIFPITKQEAEEQGYPWKEKDKKDYKITIQSEDLPDDIKDVSDDILDEVISCPNNGDQMTQCTSAFRIVLAELQFYKQKNLPLPRYCPNCRHYQRSKYRNPFRLYTRQCMCDRKHVHHEGRCEVEFETSYAPDRTEAVYCEKCYQQEVY